MPIFIRLFLKMHIGLYRLTKGKLGGRLGGNDILLLNTVGRKSGVTRTTPLVYVRDGNQYVVIASNGGASKHPAWYHNLKHQPQTTIEVLDQEVLVTAVVADGQEYHRLWQEITARHDQFRQYQEKTERSIPLFILTPQ